MPRATASSDASRMILPDGVLVEAMSEWLAIEREHPAWEVLEEAVRDAVTRAGSGMAVFGHRKLKRTFDGHESNGIV
jgi:hypothetical protein